MHLQYQAYGEQQGGGYGQYNPYAGRDNQYDGRDQQGRAGNSQPYTTIPDQQNSSYYGNEPQGAGRYGMFRFQDSLL